MTGQWGALGYNQTNNADREFTMALTMLLLGAFGLMYVTGRFAMSFWERQPEVSSIAESFWCFVEALGALVCGALFVAVMGYLAVVAGWNGSVLAVWHCFLTFFPLFIANQCPGWAKAVNLPGSGEPINAAELGAAKTWGSYYAVPGAFLAFVLQANVLWLQSPLVEYKLQYVGVAFFLACGLGAAWGDQAKSYFKRRKGIPQGAPWWPWDQDDCVLGASVLLIPLFITIGLPLVNAWLGYLILMPLVIHPIGNSIWYAAGMRKRIA